MRFPCVSRQTCPLGLLKWRLLFVCEQRRSRRGNRNDANLVSIQDDIDDCPAILDNQRVAKILPSHRSVSQLQFQLAPTKQLRSNRPMATGFGATQCSFFGRSANSDHRFFSDLHFSQPPRGKRASSGGRISLCLPPQTRPYSLQ